MPNEIICLRKEHQPQVVDILPRAFANDPMFQYLFPDGNRSKHLRTFFNFIFYKSMLLQERLIGIKENNELRGVSSIELPTSVKGAGLLLRPLFIYRGIKLYVQLPKDAFAFINPYMQFTTSVRPTAPHHYLVCIGVDPVHQGKGVGKTLLTYIHEFVDKDPSSTGIGLDTENPENVKLYERFGYHIVETKKIGDTTIYCMFRPK